MRISILRVLGVRSSSPAVLANVDDSLGPVKPEEGLDLYLPN